MEWIRNLRRDYTPLVLIMTATALLISYGVGFIGGMGYQRAATPPTPRATPAPVHAVLLDLTGSGTKQTDTFTASDHTLITWQADNGDAYAGHFVIEVYDATSHQLAGLAGNVLVPAHQSLGDTTVIHHAGHVFLSVDGTNASWHVVVTS